MTGLASLAQVVLARQRGLLLALLTVLHFVWLADNASLFGRTLWIVDVGLFILWQPFVQGERRIGAAGLVALLFALAVGLSGYGNWMLVLWSTFLTALVGGRVLFVEHRGTRLFYLLAFVYLLAAILLGLMPETVPNPGAEAALLGKVFRWFGPILLICMLLLPVRGWVGRVAAGPVDFVYSLFVFLLVAVLVLGSLAFMVVRQIGYVEALLNAVVVMAMMLLFLGVAWNPRPGFGGVGVFFSRYLLTVGLPFEQWLHRLTQLAEEERESSRFLDRAFRLLMELPWVTGGEWREKGGLMQHGQFGELGVFSQEFSAFSLDLVLHTRHRLSPALVWHFRLLAQLVAEYHMAKVRERELEQMSYLRAVYETGARLTHDVKNLLQSLNNLCYVAQSLEKDRAAEIQPLMLRQLPLITQRLEQTLEKLRRPRGGGGPQIAAEAWWSALRQRYEPQRVGFSAESCLSDTTVPTALFDSVADNLLQNALEKRVQSPQLTVLASLSEGGTVLSICDDGEPLPESVAATLFSAPVASETGLGIGLYHAARQAEEYGYALRLASNCAGKVCFELRRSAAV